MMEKRSRSCNNQCWVIMGMSSNYSSACALVFILWLTSSQKVAANENDDALTGQKIGQFVHLLPNVASARKIHIAYQLKRREHQTVFIEEFLDLDTWSQLIQLRVGSQEEATISLSLLLLNKNLEKPSLYTYEQFPSQCDLEELGSRNPDRFWDEVNVLEEPLASGRGQLHRLVETILASNSPYLFRTRISSETGTYSVWLAGLTALWARAQRVSEAEGKLTSSSQLWRFSFDDKLSSFFYFTPERESYAQSLHRSHELDAVEQLFMVELAASKGIPLIDRISVADVDLDFSSLLAKRLFQLPLGLNCPANPLASLKNWDLQAIYLNQSVVLDLEVQATRFEGKGSRPLASTNSRTVRLVRANHPTSLKCDPVKMIEVYEDSRRSIRDFYSKLRFELSDGDDKVSCKIERLSLTQSDRPASTDSVDLDLSNGLLLRLNDYTLDYLLGDAAGNVQERLINYLTLDEETDKYEEIVAESQLPVMHNSFLQLQDTDIHPSYSLIRVYRTIQEEASADLDAKKSRKASLSRIILLAINEKDGNLLGKVQINIVRSQVGPELAQLAMLLDTAACFDKVHQQLELAALYPIEADVLDLLVKRPYQVIESFYEAARGWPETVGQVINYLRAPSVSMLIDEQGRLNVKLKTLDLPSPIEMFERFPDSTFYGHHERFLLDSEHSCSHLCQQLGCRMFSFIPSANECRLAYDIVSKNQTGSVTLMHRKGAQLYIEPSDWPAGHPSLSQLMSYLEHEHQAVGFDRLEQVEEDPSGTSEEQGLRRPPRSLEFQVQGYKRSYGPPKGYQLAPTSIRLMRVPLPLDVSTEAQKVRSSSAFNFVIQNKRFDMNAQLDEINYIDRDDSSQLTLRRIRQISIEDCTRLCYDIQEYGLDGVGEQMCQAFSYCALNRDCVLAIRSQQNLEGPGTDQSHPVETKSLTELEVEFAGCSITRRNTLASFEGPRRIGEKSSGWMSGITSSALELEWLTARRLESVNLEPELLEECALECTSRNHRAKQNVCLAFDRCVKRRKVSSSSSGVIEVDTRCVLLLVRQPATLTKAEAPELNRIRTMLLDTPPPGESERSCLRYLTSSMSHFKHFRSVRASDELLQALAEQPEELQGLTADSCATECLLRPTECLAFELCSPGPDSRCRFLGRARAKISGLVGPASSYEAQCHIYLRNQFARLDEMLVAEPSRTSSEHPAFLVPCFIVAYATICVFVLLYVFRCRDRSS